MTIQETIKKYKTATENYAKIINAKKYHGENIAEMVSISHGNNKMGAIPSVSILPILTCPACCHGTCAEKCYAKKLCNLRPSVLNAYAKNTAIAMYDPESFFRAIHATMQVTRFFRFHVSGDILNSEYFEKMIQVTKKNPHCKVLVFTKKYDLVNMWIAKNGNLPENMCLLFSGWANLTPNNPYNLPETNVYKNELDIKENWTLCGGNCMECTLHDKGCWIAKKGDIIAFKMH